MQLWLERTVARWADRDQRWTVAMHRIAESPAVVIVLALASRLANGVLWYALIGVLPIVGGVVGTSCAMQMAGVGVLNLTLYRYLKPRVCRQRPFVTCPGVRACTNVLDTYSFPSGHTLHAVSFAIVVSYHYPLAAFFVLPFALVVAVSRLVLGLHYPSDVVVGGVLGAATAALVLAVN